MPGGVELTVAAFNFNAAPILIASVSAQGDTDLEGAAKIARTELIPELLSLPGVATADLAGRRRASTSSTTHWGPLAMKS